jgi:hypothetical protein
MQRVRKLPNTVSTRKVDATARRIIRPVVANGRYVDRRVLDSLVAAGPRPGRRGLVRCAFGWYRGQLGADALRTR